MRPTYYLTVGYSSAGRRLLIAVGNANRAIGDRPKELLGAVLAAAAQLLPP